MINRIVETADDAAELFKELTDAGARPVGVRVLLVGAHGSGKTMLARRIARVMPQLNARVALEAAWLRYGAGIHGYYAISPLRHPEETDAPFRAPHYSCSTMAITGGGTPVRPGEMSLAHGGTLFLDEVSNFHRSALESVAHAMRNGEVKISHRGQLTTLPARPACLIAGTTECPCGRAAAYEVSAYRGSVCCTCNPKLIAPFMARAFGGPLGSLWDAVVFLRWNREESAKFLAHDALKG